jgi:predicted transcriptional regulator
MKDTIKKNRKLDAIYNILNVFKNTSTKYNGFCCSCIRMQIYEELFDILLYKGFIIKVDKVESDYDGIIKTNKVKSNYKTTKKGDDFIIAYDSMTNYINKMNLMLR